jgi:hypothetical protein
MKSNPNYLRKLLNYRTSHKFRSKSYWTSIYPSPKPSWLRKSFSTLNDWIYNNIDNFFRGSSNIEKRVSEENFSMSDILISSQVEWDLSQDIVDIALIDFKCSLNFILPGFIKRIAFRLYQLTFLYLYTDVSNEEEFQKWNELSDKTNFQLQNNKNIYTLLDVKDEIGSKCLPINVWLKKTYSGFIKFLRLEQCRKTYFLLRYFGPKGNDDPCNDKSFMITGPDKAELNPAFSFHKRI